MVEMGVIPCCSGLDVSLAHLYKPQAECDDGRMVDARNEAEDIRSRGYLTQEVRGYQRIFELHMCLSLFIIPDSI